MTTTKDSAVMTLPSDTRILITRRFAAPPRLVYRVLTEPDLIARWWAGKRGTVTSVDVDLRAGGNWRYAMESDGMVIAFRGTYREIVPDERIVFTEIYQSGSGATDEEPGVLCTYTLTANADGTTLDLLTETPDKATRDIIAGSGMETGVQEGMNIIDELVAELAA
ncbi:SRPBCC domain-containing protein [Saccharomonospora sp. NPDC006951]